MLASRIPGNLGLLGEDYPGYFSLCNEHELATLLWKAESEPDDLVRLQEACVRRAPLFTPAREVDAWRTLLQELEGTRQPV